MDGFVRLTDFLHRRGPLVLAAAAALMIVAILGISGLSIDTRFEVFMPPDSVSKQAMESMTASFGDAGQIVAMVETPHDGPSLKKLEPLAQRLAALPTLAAVEPPLPESVLALAPDELGDAVSAIEKMTGGATLPEHGGREYALFRLMPADGANPRALVHEVEQVFAASGVSVTLAGEPYLEAKVFDYVLRILLVLPPVAVLLMLLVFSLRIGSARATLLSMVPAVVGAVLTLGGLAWIAGSVSIVSVLVPIFVVVLGSADGLHVTSHVLDALGTGESNRSAISHTLRAVGFPITMTTVTTMAGFLSLFAVNSQALRGLALTAAGGILVAGIATWFVLPALLLRQKPLQRRRQASRDRLVGLLGRMRGAPSAVLAVGLVVAAVPGVFLVDSSFSMVEVYKPNTEVRRSLDRVSEVTGGAIPVYLTYDAGEPWDPDLAKAVLRFQDRANQLGIVSHGVSVYGVVRNAYEARGIGTGYPQSEEAARSIASAIEAENPAFFHTFLSADGTGRAAFFLADLDDRTLDGFETLAQEVSSETGLELRPVGTAFVMKQMNDQIVPQQVWSLLLAAGLVLVISAITQRSLALGFVATVPIAVTLVAAFGVMGYAGIDLSIITCIMSGLTVGVGIDYAIHYVALYRQARSRKSADPASEALSYVATPILANALGLAIGFSAMAFSPLAIHVTLSILMWVTMVVSALVTLTLLPTIAGPRRSAGPRTVEQ